MDNIVIFDDEPSANGWAYSHLLQGHIGQVRTFEHISEVGKYLEETSVKLLIIEVSKAQEKALKLVAQVRGQFPKLRILIVMLHKKDKSVNVEDGPVTYMTKSSSWKFEWTVRLLLKVSTPTRPSPLPPLSTHPILMGQPPQTWQGTPAPPATKIMAPATVREEKNQAQASPSPLSLFGRNPSPTVRAPAPRPAMKTVRGQANIASSAPPPAPLQQQEPGQAGPANLMAKNRQYRPSPLGAGSPTRRAMMPPNAALTNEMKVISAAASPASLNVKPRPIPVIIPLIQNVRIPTSILNGDLNSVPVSDVLQMVCHGKQTGRLVLLREKHVGEIYLENGELVHARMGTASGEGLILALLGWRVGKFYFEANQRVEERTIERRWDYLVLEACRYRDETETLIC
ncbi:MAG: DUF4388 domain-containing protein [Verrucomicrobiota bacterium]|nr:DUF4388 domain-containing protein [Verrucomicrobiota bacterium]